MARETGCLMKTIGTFDKSEDAHLFRMRLGAAGFEAFIQHEYTVQNFWPWNPAIGGILVEIADEDYAEVMEFLRADTPQENPSAVAVKCPRCGSDETRIDELPRRIGFLGVLLAWLPLYFGRSWLCPTCGKRFYP
jgi:predicted RNA-binding Zn-ribbon protein involved in translation (DUF1610 family)